MLPPIQQTWLSWYDDISGQRHSSYGDAGSLIRSEVRGYLEEEKDLYGYELERAMRVLNSIDKMIIENAKNNKESKKGKITIPKQPGT